MAWIINIDLGFEEVMRVFERRYLTKNSTGLCSGQIFVVYAPEALGALAWLT
jgi:hypothetical protein